VTRLTGDDRIACAALTYLAEPADPLMGRLLHVLPPAAVLDTIRSGAIPAAASDAFNAAAVTELGPAITRWRAHLASFRPGTFGQHAARGIELVCPGDPQWPGQLDTLGTARPYALWVRGRADLATITTRSLAVIGARAATAYGTHVAAQIAADLSHDGHTIVSGAAYGIDAAAHRGALAASGPTIAVLACGPDVDYPRTHHGLLDAITAQGAVISETPPGMPPSRIRFLLRNRIIVALASGTVVVEAALRSGTMSAAHYARELRRPLMAVPGPVTSATSEGCHQLIRDQYATCVTSAADIAARLHPDTGSQQNTG
jgi:DNA processing protein